MNKIALAYSGGLDTSAIIPWLREHYDADVVAVVADVGQGETELAGIEDKAQASGAVDCHVVDLKDEFIAEYAFPSLIAGAVYEGRYLLGTAIARPIIARAQVEVALRCGADALAHGCTGKGNDQVRFESTFTALAPHLPVIAPWREWTFRSREDLLDYLRHKGVPCSASLEKIYSRDANLWHISHEGGELEDPWHAPPEEIWMRTASPQSAPNEPEDVMITFDHGRPTHVDGTALGPAELVAHLNAIGGRHGVGRTDLVENRLVGMKSRGCYENPGPSILHEALRGLEELVLDRETLHYREQLGHKFAELIYDGRWETSLRRALWAAAATIAEPLTGDVVVRLHKGRCAAVQRRAPQSLYAADFATFGADEVYDQSHAAGFIRLFSLPSRIAALRDLKAQETIC